MPTDFLYLGVRFVSWKTKFIDPSTGGRTLAGFDLQQVWSS